MAISVEGPTSAGLTKFRASDLILWKIEPELQLGLEREVLAGLILQNFESQPSLPPNLPLSDLFPNGPPANRLHIVVHPPCLHLIAACILFQD